MKWWYNANSGYKLFIKLIFAIYVLVYVYSHVYKYLFEHEWTMGQTLLSILISHQLFLWENHSLFTHQVDHLAREPPNSACLHLVGIEIIGCASAY